MCSTVSLDERNIVALKSIKCSKVVGDKTSSMNGERAIAHLSCKERAVDFYMKKSRITVGRSSSKRGSADVDMGESNFISRNHLEIYTTDSKFYALVTGKNGIFIDDNFHTKGGSAFELPNSCFIRFPSTSIKIQFNILDSILEDKSYTCSDSQPSKQDSPVLKNNMIGDFCCSSNHSLNVVDGGLYPVTEEVIGVCMDAESASQPEEPEDDSNVPSPANENESSTIVSSSMVSGRHTKPPYSYAQLIVQAISSQDDRQLTLSGIYNYITKMYPFYRHGDKGWQNSIRHNLSLNRYFVKVPRAQEEAGKGCFWKIDANSEDVLISQAFRKRRQRPVPYCRANSFDTLGTKLLNSESGTLMGAADNSCPSWDTSHIEDDVPDSQLLVGDQSFQHYNSIKPSLAGLSLHGLYASFCQPQTSTKTHLIFSKTNPSTDSNSFLSRHKEFPIINGSKGDDKSPLSNSSSLNELKVVKSLPIIITSQPKTIILRSSMNNNLISCQQQNLSLLPGGQFIKLSYNPSLSPSQDANSDIAPSSTNTSKTSLGSTFINHSIRHV